VAERCTRIFVRDVTYHDDRAHGLLAVLLDGTQQVIEQVRTWHPNFGDASDDAVPRRARARVDSNPYRGTPLIWAAANGRVEAARWLLDHAAPVNQRATFGGPAHGEGVTALHLAAQNDRVEMIGLLLARGADPIIQDALYSSTPERWAQHEGADRAAAAFREWSGGDGRGTWH
jgi:hypothetical protein